MFDLWTAIVNEMGKRAPGPLSIRLLIQPTVAGVLAVRDGMRDSPEGQPPYGWSILHYAVHPPYLLQSGWNGIGKVLLLVIALDLVYLPFIHHALLPQQSVFLAMVLALIPCLVPRGATTRVATLLRRPA